MSCWMTHADPVCFAHLGKYGDLAILFPGFKAIADTTGVPPVCLVANEYASIFDGISYAEPWPVNLNWYKQLDEAKAMGEAKYGHCIVPKFWDMKSAKSPFPVNGQKPINLQIHGRVMQIPAKEWESYQTAQWKASGFTEDQMMTWPLVFDRRDANREELLRKRWFKTTKPKLLVNLYPGGSSPWRYGNTILPWLTGFEIVNLANVVAYRIYDLLGLYDHAAGLVTSDTSTLHLAAASDIPYIAFVNNGGAGSVPRGNCVLKVRYDKVLQSRGLLEGALRKMRQ